MTYIGTPWVGDNDNWQEPWKQDRRIQYPSIGLPQYTPQPKPFKLGFMLGRFQHAHIGHEMVINKAAQVCEKLIVLVGSEQAYGTIRNPFHVDTRLNVLNKIFGSNPSIVLASIPDMTHEDDHCHEWGRFVLAHVATIAHNKNIKINPDVMIYGDDEERESWFDPEDVKGMSRLILSRDTIEISATQMRKWIVADNFWKWRQFASEKIHDLYPSLREELLTSEH